MKKEDIYIQFTPFHSVSNCVDMLHDSIESDYRYHFGASQAGFHCDRALWLSFRWVYIKEPPANVKRIFRRGQNEENTVIQDLKNCKFDVFDMQKRVYFDSHFSGSIDGIICGIPESPEKKHVLEIKTHNEKSFNDLEKNGVKKSKYQHYVQMQLYMYGLGLDDALYYAVCKNDDRIYTERIKKDIEVALKYIERARRIIFSDRIPEKISNDPAWYECKMCDKYDFCHVSKKANTVTCRNCAHSTFIENNCLKCELHNDRVPDQWQKEGCHCHVIHPDCVPYKLIEEKSDEKNACYELENETVINGEAGKESGYILLSSEARKIADTFDGEVVK